MIEIRMPGIRPRDVAYRFAVTLFVLLLVLYTRGADLRDVMPEQTTFSSNSADYIITIKMDDKSRLSELVFDYHGKVFSVPKSELEDIRLPLLGSVRLKTTDMDSSPKSLNLNQEDLVIVVEYGSGVYRTWYPGGKERSEKQRSCVHYIFSKSGYQFRSRSLVQAGQVKCKLFSKAVGEAETEDGFSSNDYSPDEPPFLLCKSHNAKGANEKVTDETATSTNRRFAPGQPAKGPPPAKTGSAP